MSKEQAGGKRGGSGRELDISDFDGGEGDGLSLELDGPASGTQNKPAPAPAPPPPPPPPSSSHLQPAPHSSGHQPAQAPGPAPMAGAPEEQQPQQAPAPPPRPAPPPKPRRLKRHELPPEVRAAMDVAEYGDPPDAFWQMPVYALRVLWRKHELRNELLQARVAGRADRVKMFEDALKVDDSRSVTLGVIMTVLACFLLFVLALTPVAIRFIKLAMYG